MTRPYGVSNLKFVVIGNSENRRVQMFNRALSDCGLSPAIVLDYGNLLNGVSSFRKTLESLHGRVAIRIESPGENFEVEKRLIALGAEHSDNTKRWTTISAQEALKMDFDQGRLRFTTQWYLGFSKFLAQIKDDAHSCSLEKFDWFNHPDEIRWMFDKSRCQEHLESCSIPTPKRLIGISCFDSLRDRLNTENRKKIFIKLNHSSSGSGVLALARNGSNFRAVTSMELVENSKSPPKIYNNLKLCVYTEIDQIRVLVDYLLREGARVEEWLPKASTGGRSFDLRIVVIRNRAKHAVVRTSQSPITNLHLGNRRGDLLELIEQMGQEKWQTTLNIAEAASRLFPKSVYQGIDILLKPGFREPTVLEVNAFGDLLPNVTYQGKDTYRTEIESLA